METDAAFIRADGLVELDAVAEIGLHVAVVVDPCHAESKYSVRFYHPFDDTCLFKFGVLVIDVGHADQHFLDGLKIFFLTGMLRFKRAHDLINVHSLCIELGLG